MQPPALRPTVIVPDTAPLIHLAAGGALDILTGMGRVVVPDVVVPNLLLREGVAATVAVATPRNLLTLAQDHGLIPDAAAVWARIVAAAPPANPVSALTFINPTEP